MEKLVLDNLIGGKTLLMSGKRFEVPSPFYEDFSAQAADSGLFDLKTAVSKAKNASLECRALTFSDREQILKRVAKKLRFGSLEKEYAVKMTGMPVHYVEKHLDEIPELLAGLPHLIRKRLNIFGSSLQHRVAEGSNLYSVLHPVEGFVYAITPGNDPRVVAFVTAWCVALGIPLVLKPSKTDLLAPSQLAQALVDQGYPAGGVNIVSWNSESPDSLDKNFSLVDSASVIWAFGEDNTVDKILRFSTDDKGQRVDHFAGKTVLRHSSGRGAAVHDSFKDIKKTARIIAESSFQWPIACNSLKALFTAHEEHEELLGKIRDITVNEFVKHVGDPMNANTRVGYVNANTLKHIRERLAWLKKLGSMKEIMAPIFISPFQATPMIIETKDKNSEFLSKEHSTYVLAIKKCKSFEEAVSEVNSSGGEAKRIAITVLSDNERKVLDTYLHAHHIKRLRHSTEFDLMYHEGNDYIHKLMVPQIHRLDKPKQVYAAKSAAF